MQTYTQCKNNVLHHTLYKSYTIMRIRCFHTRFALGENLGFVPSHDHICMYNCTAVDPVETISNILCGNVKKLFLTYDETMIMNKDDIALRFAKYFSSSFELIMSRKFPVKCLHSLKLSEYLKEFEPHDLALFLIICQLKNSNCNKHLFLHCSFNDSSKLCLEESLYILKTYGTVRYKTKFIDFKSKLELKQNLGISKHREITFQHKKSDVLPSQLAATTINMIMSAWLTSTSSEHIKVAKAWFKNKEKIDDCSQEVAYDIMCVTELISSSLIGPEYDVGLCATILALISRIKKKSNDIIINIEMSLLRTVIARLPSAN